MKEFEELADIYNTLTSKEDKEQLIPFYKKIIKEYNIKNCLDCSCGIGWDLYHISNLGIKVYGSDQSKKMITLAKKNLKDKVIELKVEDFRTLNNSWKIKFDLIICLDNSINYMLNKQDYIKALRSMYNQLNKNGILILSNGINDKLLKYKPTFFPVKELENEALYFFMEYLEDLIKMKILYIKKEEKIKHVIINSNINTVGIDKLNEFISKTNFEILSTYGDYSFNNYKKYESEKIVVVLRKNENTACNS